MDVKGQILFTAWTVTKWSVFQEQICSMYFEMPGYLVIDTYTLKVLTYALIITKQGGIISWN